MNFDRLEITDEDGNYHVPNPAICLVAVKLYELWPIMGGIYLQRVPSVKAKDGICFYRAAAICVELGLVPEVYIHRVFEGMARVGQYWPKLICSRRMLELGSEPDATRRERDLAHYQSQVYLFNARAPIYGTVPLLSDDTVAFTPLFRCVMGHVSGAKELAMKYKDAARLELAAVPVAREVFADQIPEFLQ